MKTLIRFIAAAALLAVMAGQAEATVYQLSSTPFSDNAVSLAPGVEVQFPATFTSSDSAYVYVPFPKYYNPAANGSTDGTYTLTICYGMDLTVATDSCSVTIGTGSATNGPFTTPFSAALQSLVLTGTTPWVIKNDVALTSIPPAPLLRLAVKGKGTTVAYKKMWIRFPRIAMTPMGSGR